MNEDEKRKKLVNSVKSIFSKATEDEKVEAEALNADFNKPSLKESATKDEKVESKYSEIYKKPSIEKSVTPDENKYDDEEIDIAKQREQVVGFVKKYANWFITSIFLIIVWFGSYIRSRNISLLKDVTTGKYLPLALDPHSFLRYAEYIMEHGFLLSTDFMRFVPVGRTTADNWFLSYYIVYQHKILDMLGLTSGLDYSAVIYPIITFAIGAIFFYLLVNKLFGWKTALLSTLFLSILPAYLYRTMAGFSDKEALAMVFFFAAMYFFVLMFKSKSDLKSILWGALAGISTGSLGLIWGGVKFILMIFALYVLVEFLLHNFEKNDFYGYASWLALSVIMLGVMTPRYGGFTGLVRSITSGAAIFVFAIVLVDYIVFKNDLFKIKDKLERKLPSSISSVILTVLFGAIIITALFGMSFWQNQLADLSNSLLRPLGTNRWMLTVAEQHQPYFLDWWSSFSYFFYFFFIGSIWLFHEAVKPIKKYRIGLTVLYTLFISGFIFSRYSQQSSILNGETAISKILYIGSLVLFVLVMLVIYLRSYYQEKDVFKKFMTIENLFVFTLIWFIVMVVAARGAIRLLFVFAPVTAVLGSYLVIKLYDYFISVKDTVFKVGGIVLLAAVTLLLVTNFASSSLEQSQYTGPSYNNQWQYAGKWIRESTPLDSVFGHWWDYGYWVQTGGERATMLDGGNSIVYWNYLMGRHGLGAQTQEEALELLKVHNVTHFLIISDEIGKYTAYSSIGSDESYDRYSWITTFAMDQSQTQETRNETIYVYPGMYVLDDDFVINGKVFPAKESAVVGILIPLETVDIKIGNETQKTQKMNQPTLVLSGRAGQQRVPLECVYVAGNMLKFEQEGYKGCFRIIPQLDDSGNLANPIGAGLFVSEEGVKALWTNLYLFEQNNPDFDTSAFKIAYSDEASVPLARFRGRTIGPLKIWEIDYPENFKVDQETWERYSSTDISNLPDYFFDV